MVNGSGMPRDNVTDQSQRSWVVVCGLLALWITTGAQAEPACRDIECLHNPIVRTTLLDEPFTRAQASRVLYVDASASGQATGLHWEDAWTSLQDALDQATTGDQIWIAQGTYRPDDGTSVTKGDRTASFVISSGVALYGGFPAGGADWEARSPRTFRTILSGDLKHNDRPGFWFHGDNAFHVMTLIDGHERTILNGCTIVGGNADAADGSDSKGGGLLVKGGRPLLQECTFRDNRAVYGGAMWCDNASPVIARCMFTLNYGAQKAGAMYNTGGSCPVVVGTTFRENSAFVSGGALENASSPSCPTLINSILHLNRAGKGGGVASCVGSRPVLWNCTLFGNTAREEGGALWNERYMTEPLIVNCILWQNADSSGDLWPGQIVGGAPDIRYSCIQGWVEGRVGIGNIGAKPYFADPEGGDFHLKSLAGRWHPPTRSWTHDYVTSACIDSGDPEANWFDEHWPHGGKINMGAYGGTLHASLTVNYYTSAGDANHDFRLDMADVQTLGAQWLRQDVAADQDLNRDGIVNMRDFALMAEQWRWFSETPWAGQLDVSRIVYPESDLAFEELRTAISNNYSHYDLRGLDWEDLFEQYAPILKASPDTCAFAEGAAELLGNANDPHIFMFTKERSYVCFDRDVTPNVNAASLPQLVPQWVDHNARVSAGRYPDGVGYIQIKTWNAADAHTIKVVYAILNDMRDAPGLILDVRSNAGGCEALAADVAGCFLTEPKLYAKYREVQAGAEVILGPVKESWVQPNSNAHYSGPVAVLMGPVCMNACESFLLMMRQVENCTLVGETSYGSSGRPRYAALSNGVRVLLPSWSVLLPDESVLEGVGVVPDVEVSTSPAVLNGSDPVLDRALTLLR